MSATGLDRVELLLAAGPSEPLRQLGAIASGGECARVMLALKAAPAHAAAVTRVDGGSAAADGAATSAACSALFFPGSRQPLMLWQPSILRQREAEGMGRADATRLQRRIAAADARASDERGVDIDKGGCASGPDGPGFLMIEEACGHRGIFPLAEAAAAVDAADALRGGPSPRHFDGDTADLDGELAALGAPVIILDEIDAGVGSRLGLAMARMLRAMARHGQILAVSHVPQARSPRRQPLARLLSPRVTAVAIACIHNSQRAGVLLAHPSRLICRPVIASGWVMGKMWALSDGMRLARMLARSPAGPLPPYAPRAMWQASPHISRTRISCDWKDPGGTRALVGDGRSRSSAYSSRRCACARS